MGILGSPHYEAAMQGQGAACSSWWLLGTPITCSSWRPPGARSLGSPLKPRAARYLQCLGAWGSPPPLAWNWVGVSLTPQHLGAAGVTPPAGVAGSLRLPCHFMPGLQFSCCNAHRGWEVRVFPATASRELVPQPAAAGSLGVPLLPVVAGSSGALQMLRGCPATPCASGRCGLCSSQPSEAEVTDSVTKSET